MPINDLPVYHTLAEVEQAMRLVLQDEAEDEDDEHEMYGRDFVLAGMVAFLAESWPEKEKEQILSLLDVYCGKPMNVVVDADPVTMNVIKQMFHDPTPTEAFLSILAPYRDA